MIRNINANLKSVAVDPSDDFRKLNDLNNPYCYNFGRAKREHSHSCDFQFTKRLFLFKIMLEVM